MKYNQNPVEVLRYMQKTLLKGRQLEVSDVSVNPTGDTNFILVDRNNLITSAFEELKDIKDFSITLEVQFYNEVRSSFVKL